MVLNENYAKQITLSYVISRPLRARKKIKDILKVHYKLTNVTAYNRITKVISVFTALTKASVLFFGSSLRGKEFRRNCVGEVRSEAAGTSPDVKPAPQ